MINEFINAIEITFENLDYVRIPIEYIGIAKFERLTVLIEQISGKVTQKRSSAKSVYLNILGAFQCDEKKIDENTDICEAFDKRISENDITCLRIHYMNDTYEDIWVSWEDNGVTTCKNSLQKVDKDENGNFIVQIGGM